MSVQLTRCESFCGRIGIQVPIWLAPMAGATPPALSIAIAEGGGLGASGALLMGPPEMRVWAEAVRAHERSLPDESLGPRPIPSPRPRARGARARIPRALGSGGTRVIRR